MLVRSITGEWFEKTKNMFENILEKNKKHKIYHALHKNASGPQRGAWHLLVPLSVSNKGDDREKSGSMPKP